LPGNQWLTSSILHQTYNHDGHLTHADDMYNFMVNVWTKYGKPSMYNN